MSIIDDVKIVKDRFQGLTTYGSYTAAEIAFITEVLCTATNPFSRTHPDPSLFKSLVEEAFSPTHATNEVQFRQFDYSGRWRNVCHISFSSSQRILGGIIYTFLLNGWSILMRTKNSFCNPLTSALAWKDEAVEALLDIWPDPAILVNDLNANSLQTACIYCLQRKSIGRMLSLASPETLNAFNADGAWTPIFCAIDALRLGQLDDLPTICKSIRLLIQYAYADRSGMKLIGTEINLRAALIKNDKKQHLLGSLTTTECMTIAVQQHLHTVHKDLVLELQSEFMAAVQAQEKWPIELRRMLKEILVISLLLPIDPLVSLVVDYLIVI